jgi:hypothetical protein
LQTQTPKPSVNANHDPESSVDVAVRVHESLRESFTPLPPKGTTLSPEQLQAVFGGDLKTLKEMTRLTQKPRKYDPEA